MRNSPYTSCGVEFVDEQDARVALLALNERHAGRTVMEPVSTPPPRMPSKALLPVVMCMHCLRRSRTCFGVLADGSGDDEE